ncbi:MAG: bifunctional adenosylcobinamide kinase/adenosylcobinamide-phosphate guanylyltransferase [Deferrisomatales bacterium]
MTGSGPRREIVFFTGGARSGKSRLAQERTERWEGRLLYIATAQVRDREMRDRVDKHRRDRGPRWDTREEPLELAAALQDAEAYGGALLDCLTLWTSNLLEACGDDEGRVRAAVDGLLEALEGYRGRLSVVTNEVGSGIVPANALARRFRDWAGWINQAVAARASEAFLVASGLPLRLK